MKGKKGKPKKNNLKKGMEGSEKERMKRKKSDLVEEKSLLNAELQLVEETFPHVLCLCVCQVTVKHLHSVEERLRVWEFAVDTQGGKGGGKAHLRHVLRLLHYAARTRTWSDVTLLQTFYTLCGASVKVTTRGLPKTTLAGYKGEGRSRDPHTERQYIYI